LKLVVIGLDCLEPSLVDQWLVELPTFARLRAVGAWGTMNSCTPPITVPAWSVMMSSCDPGTLGVYGFRNRTDHSYAGLGFATSDWIREPRLWDHLSQAGKTCCLIGVPGTFPPSPVNGSMISCFLTPKGATDWTYPPELKQKVAQLLDGKEYLFDVNDFRTADKERILADILEMTRRRFTVARGLYQEQKPDFFMMVEMGSDRIHHGFWHTMDPQHRKYDPKSPFASAIKDYYKLLDREMASFLELVDFSNTTVVVISDHGAKRLDGGICVNDWLRREGYLVLKSNPAPGTTLQKCDIDWTQTTAWGEGGYYARIFLNVRGREPQGIVPPEDYEKFRGELGHKLNAIPDDQGKPIKTVSHKPQHLYPRVRGIAPDLITIFGDLHWRAVGTLGYDSLYLFENDTGPDEANHAQHGFYSWFQPGVAPAREPRAIDILDVMPTALKTLGLPIPRHALGKALDFAAKEEPTHPAPAAQAQGVPESHTPGPAVQKKPAYTEKQQGQVEKHLESLGYLG